MKNIIYIKLAILVIIIIGVVFLQVRGFWFDLKVFGAKNSISVLSESFSCVKEGDILSSTVNNKRKSCCKDLIKISLDKPSEDKNSINGCTQFMIGGVYCTKCGDNICGSGENKCNCPTDCKINNENK